MKIQCSSSWEQGKPITKNSEFTVGLYLDNDDEAKLLANNAISLRAKIEPLLKEIKDVENGTFYPYFGYGSKAEKMRQQVETNRKKTEDAIKAIRRLNPEARIPD